MRGERKITEKFAVPLETRTSYWSWRAHTLINDYGKYSNYSNVTAHLLCTIFPNLLFHSIRTLFFYVFQACKCSFIAVPWYHCVTFRLLAEISTPAKCHIYYRLTWKKYVDSAVQCTPNMNCLISPRRLLEENENEAYVCHPRGRKRGTKLGSKQGSDIISSN